MIREKYPDKKYEVPMVVFVQKRLREELSSLGYSDFKEQIIMTLRESYFRFAMGEDEQAYAREKMARQIYDFYYENTEDQNRIGLPDFKFIRFAALLDFFNDQQYPAKLRMNLIKRIQQERPELADQIKEQQEMLRRQIQQQQKSEE